MLHGQLGTTGDSEEDEAMKVRLIFKTPDVIERAVNEMGIRDVYEKMAVADACKPWVQYGEILTVEIDTDANTCQVVPA